MQKWQNDSLLTAEKRSSVELHLSGSWLAGSARPFGKFIENTTN